MNPVLAEILSTRTVVGPDGGYAYGLSTLFICEALAEVGGERHIVIDPHQEEGWKGLGVEPGVAVALSRQGDASSSACGLLMKEAAKTLRL